MRETDCGIAVTILGQEYNLPLTNLKFEDLVPDPTNPRHSYHLQVIGQLKGLDPDGVYAYYWSNDEAEDTKMLRNSILQNKGLIEPLFVRRRKDGKYVVREGNRRWCCYRNLREDKETSEFWSKQLVPVYILGNEIDELTVEVFIGQIHCQGKKGWNAYERAKYISMLARKLNNKDVAALMGISVQEVERAIYNHKMVDEIQRSPIRKKVDVRTKYSPIYEALKTGTSKAVVDADPEVRRGFIQAFAENKVPNNHKARQLIPILQNPKSRKVLEKVTGEDAFDKALHALQDVQPTKSGVFKIIAQMSHRLNTSHINIVRDLTKRRSSEQRRIYEEFVQEVLRVAVAANFDIVAIQQNLEMDKAS